MEVRPIHLAASPYVEETYVRAMVHLGEPLELPGSGGYLVKRPIPATDRFDAMGPYPMFNCRDWHLLDADLQAQSGSLVSVAVVVDPLARTSEAALRSCFPHVCIPFKEHYVVELHHDEALDISAHHRYKIRRALRRTAVEIIPSPVSELASWLRFYDHLRARHKIFGPADFPRASFELQLKVPGCIMFCASQDGERIGAQIWYEAGENAYYHLGAYDDSGYQAGASYALMDAALGFFRARGLRYANLGGVAGTSPGKSPNGLARFKGGWTSTRRTAYFCGRILQPDIYHTLAGNAGRVQGDFFPAYRHDDPKSGERP